MAGAGKGIFLGGGGLKRNNTERERERRDVPEVDK